MLHISEQLSAFNFFNDDGILMNVNIVKFEVFLDMTQCSLLVICRNSGVACCFRLQGRPYSPRTWQASTKLHGVTLHKAVIFILTVVRISDLM
jgi:hypothetical protein